MGHPGAREKLLFNETLRQVLNFFASDLVFFTKTCVQSSNVSSVEDVRSHPNRLAGFSESVAENNADLKRFLFKHIYDHPSIAEDRDRSVNYLEALFAHYLASPGSMPASYEELAQMESRHIIVCDYIAGMTDQFLLRRHLEHFGDAGSGESM